MATERPLEGVIDLHVHGAPDVRPRCANEFELAWEAAGQGMRAILLKNHHFETASRAALVSEVVPGIEVCGAICLNEWVGGLNPAAAEAALQLGAKEVWMPTLSAANHCQHFGLSGLGISILDADDQVRGEVRAVLRLIAEADAILGTGHLSLPEVKALVRLALDMGLGKILVTHPEWPATHISLEQQRELYEPERVFFERCLNAAAPPERLVPFERIVEGIQELGAECTVISTDFGQVEHPRPVEGMTEYLRLLAKHGVSQEDIDLMARRNPARLLGLDQPLEAA